MDLKRLSVQVLDGTSLEGIGSLIYTAYTSVQVA